MHRFRTFILSSALVCSMAFAASSESFGGIGVTITPSQSGVQVVDIIPGSPAAQAGLQANDQITSIDGVSLIGLTIDQCREKIRGAVGSTLEVGLIRGAVATTATMERAGLAITDINSQSVESWYGKTTDLSSDELSYLAEKDAASGTALLGVMQNGRVLSADATVNAEQLQGVYMTLPQSQDDAPALRQAAGSSLRLFSRSSIAFELKSAGTAVLRLVNSQGQTVRSMTIEQAKTGINTHSWDGSAIANGSYTLRIEHQGTVSGYNVNLR